MSWHVVGALFCGGLATVCFGIAFYRRKPPVIKQKPQPDSRLYSVGRDVK